MKLFDFGAFILIVGLFVSVITNLEQNEKIQKLEKELDSVEVTAEVN